jgi:hypothetical protein
MPKMTTQQEAWQTWVSSKEGDFLIRGKAEGQILFKRMQRAFLAGWTVREKEDEDGREKDDHAK